MDRVVTINRCAQEGRGGLNVRHPPLATGAGRNGTRKASQTSETKFPVAIAHAMPTPSYTGEENKFLQRDGSQQAKRLGNARQDEGYAAEL